LIFKFPALKRFSRGTLPHVEFMHERTVYISEPSIIISYMNLDVTFVFAHIVTFFYSLYIAGKDLTRALLTLLLNPYTPAAPGSGR
jgi:hypothetical protein